MTFLQVDLTRPSWRSVSVKYSCQQAASPNVPGSDLYFIRFSVRKGPFSQTILLGNGQVAIEFLARFTSLEKTERPF